MAVPLQKIVNEGELSVLVISNNTYMKKIGDIAKHLGKNYKAICYVSLNKMYDALDSSLKKQKIDTSRFLYIDGVTKSVKKNVGKEKNCIYISTPQALTELSIAINKVIGSGQFDALLFDSLSTLLIYNKAESVCKFIHTFTNKVRAQNMTAIFTALSSDTETSVLKELGMYVDAVETY